MTPPTSWRGADGTVYKFVAASEVAPDRPRWWVDEIPDHGDRCAGPAEPARLHLLSALRCGVPRVPWALVLPLSST